VLFEGLLIVLLKELRPDYVIVMNDFTAEINRECLSVAGLRSNISGQCLCLVASGQTPHRASERQAVSVRRTLPAVAYLS
jgi:hypothetical protein